MPISNMKIKILGVVIFLSLASASFSYDGSYGTTVGQGTAFQFNDVYKQMNKIEYSVKYNVKENKSEIYFTNIGLVSTFVIFFDRDQRAKLLSYLDKFQDWKKKATKDRVKLEKDIGTFNAGCLWEANNQWHLCDNSGDVSSSFFSQSKTEHQFVLQFPIYSGYLTDRPDTVYFSDSQAKALKNMLSDGQVQKAINKANKNKKVLDEFK